MGLSATSSLTFEIAFFVCLEVLLETQLEHLALVLQLLLQLSLEVLHPMHVYVRINFPSLFLLVILFIACLVEVGPVLLDRHELVELLIFQKQNLILCQAEVLLLHSLVFKPCFD